jgi:TatD DNase family protein
MRLTDTHCHLDFDRFDNDREQVITRAVDSGVERILIPGIDLDSSEAAIRLADKHTEVYAAIGVHPNYGQTWNSNTIKTFKILSQHPKVLAIGEIGLDYYREWTPHNIQKRNFELQLDLAAELQLPVVIHCRDSFQDIQRMLSDWVNDLPGNGFSSAPGIMHSFSGNFEQAEPFIELNFLFGISGPVTFKNAEETRQTVARLPLDKILIETDAPYLTPHPYRGKRNEPAYVRYIAEKIAEVRNLSPTQISDITYENSLNIFTW